jgi:hypothetical protein
MSIPVANRIIQGVKDLPDPKNTDDEFWKTLKDPSFKGTVNIMLVHAACQHDPVMLNDEQCRAQLAKICTLGQLLMTPDTFAESIANSESMNRNDDF